MDCHEATDLLSAYIDGELNSVESKNVTNHLSVCEFCRKELFELQQTIDLLRELPDLAPPADLPAKVMGRIKEQAQKRPWLAFSQRYWLSFGAVAAAVLLFIVTTSAISPLRTYPLLTGQDMAADQAPAPAAQRPPGGSKTLKANGITQNEDNIIEGHEGLDLSLSKEAREGVMANKNDVVKTKLGSSPAQKTVGDTRSADIDIAQNSFAAGETDMAIPDHGGNGDKDLNNRGINYRSREDHEESAVLTDETPSSSIGFDYSIFLHPDDKKETSQEISQIVYSLGGNVLGDDAVYLEVAVPSTRLEAAITAFKNQSSPEEVQFSDEDVFQAIDFLKEEQENLSQKIKELESELSKIADEDEAAVLESKIAEHYADLKTTQVKLKTIANGNAIIKIYLD